MALANGHRNGNHVPDNWQTEALVCPDEHCHHMIVNAERVNGRPYCAGPIHKSTGKYPRMERLRLGIKERVK